MNYDISCRNSKARNLQNSDEPILKHHLPSRGNFTFLDTALFFKNKIK